MADVFISYAAEDRLSIEPLARSLASQGLSVFWDVKLPAGQTYRDVLSKELTASKCIVVAWSKHSVSSRWVIDEAERALELGRLVPITLDGTAPPLGFRQIHAARLINWGDDVSDPQYTSLVSSILSHTEAVDAPHVSQMATSRKEASLVVRYIEDASRLFLLFLTNVLCVLFHGWIFFVVYFAASRNLWIAAGVGLVIEAAILAITSMVDASKMPRSWIETDLEWLASNTIVLMMVIFCFLAWTEISFLAVVIFCLTFFPFSFMGNYIGRVRMG